VAGVGEIDEVDYFGTFTPKEAAAIGVIPLSGDIEAPVDDDSEPTMTNETFEKRS
jgi:hypothetical protein